VSASFESRSSETQHAMLIMVFKREQVYTGNTAGEEKRSVRRRAGGLLLLGFAFSWQASRIFVGAFAEAAFQTCGQGDAGLAKFVAQAVRG